MARSGRWPRLLPTLSFATGVLLIIGLIVAPGIVMGLDDMDSAPWWVWVGFVSWLGTFVLRGARLEQHNRRVRRRA